MASGPATSGAFTTKASDAEREARTTVIVVVGTFRLPPASLEASRVAMASVIAASRAETGCIAYGYAEDVTEPGLFRVNEAWENREALAAHFETAHMKAWQRERAELGMTDRKVTAYEVAGEEAL
jgi:quinol monooxygenase YgiN